jgi:hypothetical protein
VSLDEFAPCTPAQYASSKVLVDVPLWSEEDDYPLFLVSYKNSNHRRSPAVVAQDSTSDLGKEMCHRRMASFDIGLVSALSISI